MVIEYSKNILDTHKSKIEETINKNLDIVCKTILDISD